MTIRMLAFVLTAVLLPKEPAVSIHLSRTVVMFNTQSLALYCVVPRNPHNRTLEYGIVDVAPGSQRQLDGEHAPKNFPPVFYEHLPCEADTAYCSVQTDSGEWTIARAPFQVVCTH